MTKPLSAPKPRLHIALSPREFEQLAEIYNAHPLGSGTPRWAACLAIRWLHSTLFAEDPVLIGKILAFKEFLGRRRP
jgi:hypothetical protein